MKTTQLRRSLFFTLLIIITTYHANGQTPKDWADYQKAIVNAMSPEPSKIYGGLVPIVNYNYNLNWKTINGENYILVATWKGDASRFIPYVDSPYYTTPSTDGSEIWITTSPELLNRFEVSDGVDTNMRLKQMLGLPPNSVYNYFVEFWVRPEDLFRPCADNEITDGTCGLTFPANTPTSYQAWVNGNRISRYYQGSLFEKYPWTQLGYTYDWNPENKTHVGLSEFVIGKNKKIIVQAIYTTSQYIKQKPPTKQRKN
jgi:hypothetical protein